jgi:hypothetical protein
LLLAEAVGNTGVKTARWSTIPYHSARQTVQIRKELIFFARYFSDVCSHFQCVNLSNFLLVHVPLARLRARSILASKNWVMQIIELGRVDSVVFYLGRIGERIGLDTTLVAVR